VKAPQTAPALVLWSRLLTHAGDQAWDFCVPLALIAVFPERLGIVSTYYLGLRLASVALMPRVGAAMDRWSRAFAARVGIGVQTLGVIGGTAVLAHLYASGGARSDAVAGWLALLVVFGVAGGLGATLMDIAVSQDWIPEIVGLDDLPRINARLRQVDLGTELLAPIAAGFVLAAAPGFTGVALIAGWNILSFVPEYGLLARALRADDRLARKPPAPAPAESAALGLVASLVEGWRTFRAEPVALSVVAYSCLWLTALSPHGVLLTAWLKAEWHMPEPLMGAFRGLGAVFGLLATLVFPALVRRYGLLRSSLALIWWQAFCLIAALVFAQAGAGRAYAFLGVILLSRIGLYGFSLGEAELRQTLVDRSRRGRVNGVAAALNNLMTLGLYGAGSVLESTREFPVLIAMSVVAVTTGAVVFSAWCARRSSYPHV
jgi:iron-regulated transporter 1